MRGGWDGSRQDGERQGWNSRQDGERLGWNSRQDGGRLGWSSRDSGKRQDNGVMGTHNTSTVTAIHLPIHVGGKLGTTVKKYYEIKKCKNNILKCSDEIVIIIDFLGTCT